jgi:hypothetical protein
MSECKPEKGLSEVRGRGVGAYLKDLSHEPEQDILAMAYVEAL